MTPRDEFYVGYFDAAPPGVARLLQRAVATVAVLAVVTAVLVAMNQAPQPTGRFEFGRLQAFEGVLYETPLPTLRVTHAAGTAELSAVSNFLLSGFGKHGLPEVARGKHGRKVRFEGTLVYRENLAMVELTNPGSFQDLGQPTAREQRGPFEVLGAIDLVGELVDTKCYLGVMRPATGKVHRACAVRCLAGGVPPGLLVRGVADQDAVFALIGADGGPLQIDPQLAGRRLRVQGKLELHDGLPVIKTGRPILAPETL